MSVWTKELAPQCAEWVLSAVRELEVLLRARPAPVWFPPAVVRPVPVAAC